MRSREGRRGRRSTVRSNRTSNSNRRNQSREPDTNEPNLNSAYYDLLDSFTDSLIAGRNSGLLGSILYSHPEDTFRRRRELTFNVVFDLFDNISNRLRLIAYSDPSSMQNINGFFTFIINEPFKFTNKTLKKEEVDKLKKERYNSKEKKDCPICYLSFKKNDFIRNLDCKHIFHTKCIDPWLLSGSDKCPMCRKEVL